MDTPTGRRVLLGKDGEEHGIAILPEHYDTLPAGPNGETYRALGYKLLAWEDTREPYKEPRRAVPKE